MTITSKTDYKFFYHFYIVDSSSEISQSENKIETTIDSLKRSSYSTYFTPAHQDKIKELLKIYKNVPFCNHISPNRKLQMKTYKDFEAVFDEFYNQLWENIDCINKASCIYMHYKKFHWLNKIINTFLFVLFMIQVCCATRHLPDDGGQLINNAIYSFRLV